MIPWRELGVELANLGLSLSVALSYVNVDVPPNFTEPHSAHL